MKSYILNNESLACFISICNNEGLIFLNFFFQHLEYFLQCDHIIRSRIQDYQESEVKKYSCG